MGKRPDGLIRKIEGGEGGGRGGRGEEEEENQETELINVNLLCKAAFGFF
jgi:hypothetical protein